MITYIFLIISNEVLYIFLLKISRYVKKDILEVTDGIKLFKIKININKCY